LLIVAALTAASAGCGDSEPTQPEPEPGVALEWVTPQITDSIQAQRSVTIAVTDLAGAPRRNAAVLFELVEPAAEPCPPALIGPNPVITDALGHATANVRLGCRVGTETLRASVQDLASRTLGIEQRPGASVRVGFSESAIEIGTTRRIMGAFDRLGNFTDDPVEIRGGGQAAVLVSQGTVFGQAYGMEEFRVSSPALGLELRAIAVVPRATIAWASPQSNKGVLIGDLTGRVSRTLLPEVPVAVQSWSPDGSRLAFNWWGRFELWLANTADETRRQIVPDLVAASWPEFSSDGSWLYFHGRLPTGTEHVYRARLDGSAPQLLIDADDSFMPTPSPDGTRLAYVRAPASNMDELYVRDLASGQETLLGSRPLGPRWSPDGQWIAYSTWGDDKLIVVRPDGSERRELGAGGPSISWSADSRWIVTVPNYRGIVLYDLQGGARLEVPRYQGPEYEVAYVAWKP
jgi:hypothetical protein